MGLEFSVFDKNLLLSIDKDDRDEELEKLLAKHAGKPLTKKEIRAQRVSWVMGMLPHDSTMTREQVEELLSQRYGW